MPIVIPAEALLGKRPMLIGYDEGVTAAPPETLSDQRPILTGGVEGGTAVPPETLSGQRPMLIGDRDGITVLGDWSKVSWGEPVSEPENPFRGAFTDQAQSNADPLLQQRISIANALGFRARIANTPTSELVAIADAMARLSSGQHAGGAVKRDTRVAHDPTKELGVINSIAPEYYDAARPLIENGMRALDALEVIRSAKGGGGVRDPERAWRFAQTVAESAQNELNTYIRHNTTKDEYGDEVFTGDWKWRKVLEARVQEARRIAEKAAQEVRKLYGLVGDSPDTGERSPGSGARIPDAGARIPDSGQIISTPVSQRTAAPVGQGPGNIAIVGGGRYGPGVRTTRVDRYGNEIVQPGNESVPPGNEQRGIGAGGGVPTIFTLEQYNVLPHGAMFIDGNDGLLYRKP